MNQLKLTFGLEQPQLPREFDKLLVSFLKATTKAYSEEFYEKLYGQPVMKTFCFSYSLPCAAFQSNIIQLDKNCFTLFFSDANIAELVCFASAFQKMKYKPYPVSSGNHMQLLNIETMSLGDIQTSGVLVDFQSSLIVRDHDHEHNTDEFLTCLDSEFSEVVARNVESFLKRFGYHISMDGFSIMAVKGKKIVTSCFGKLCDGSIGLFWITGKPELLNLLYAAGIGSYRSQGHGKFKIVT